MTKRSKHSFASVDQAKEYQAKYGGTLAKFDEALREAYVDMSTDVSMIRKMREERRKRAAEQKPG
jgi:nitrous oxide reductase accessory protein NosL